MVHHFVILNKVKELFTSTLCLQILRKVQNDKNEMIAFQSLDILFCIYLFINDFHLLPYAFFVDGFEYFFNEF